MKTILVVLLVSAGVGLLVVAPMVNDYFGDSTFGVTVLGHEYKTTAALPRLMHVASGLMILVAILVGLFWRPKAPANST